MHLLTANAGTSPQTFVWNNASIIHRSENWRSGTLKLLRVMKLTAILLLATCLHVAARTSGQTVTFSFKKAPLKEVFREIQKQTGMNVMVKESLLVKAGKVTIDVKNMAVDDALALCLKNLPLNYKIASGAIVVEEKPISDVAIGTGIPRPPIDISGRLTDPGGNPIAGASVFNKTTGKGTYTNDNGEFSLNVNVGDVLVFSSIGFVKKEVAINSNNSSITILLSKSVSTLDDVQIIAYGTTSKRYNTGNVTTVKAADIQKQPVSNALLALQGRVPGMVITQNSGVPGAGITIRIQGQNSLNRGNSPLYVIDGVPYTSQLLANLSGTTGILGYNGEPSNTTFSPYGGGNPLSFINPADIESIDILKDADATSIYGSRAAQGAILITTKKGKAGKSKVDLNVQSGWGKVTRMLNLLNTQQYLEMRREAKANDGAAILPSDYDINGTWDANRYTNWQKELIGGTAQYNDAQASLSGGTINTNFLVSAGYHKETTVFPGDLGDKKGSLHFNINHSSVSQKFHFQLTGNYVADNNQLISTDLTETAIKLAPNAPALYNSDGSINWATLPNGNSTWYNPLAYFYNKKYSIITNNLVSNALIGYRILPGLDVKTSFGYTNLQVNEVQINPLSAVPPQSLGSAQRSGRFANNNISSWIVEPQVTYKKAIDKLKLEALAGATIQQNNSKGQVLLGLGFPSDEVIKDINSAPTIRLNRPTVNSIYKYNALFGRIHLGWDDRYLISLTARRDGSSRFGKENYFHNFGSVAGAWVFSNEDFIKNNLSIISFGKLRGSYGTTGSDQIGDYQFMNLYNPYNVTVPYNGVASLTPSGIPNPNLQWEETKKLQFGLDLGFLEDRILLNANYFRNRSSNLLQPYELPLITGAGSIQRNFPAVIQNTGWEFSLTTRNVASKKFSWNSSINLTIPRNKLVEFPNLDKSSYADTYIIGQPISIIKTFSFSGVDPSTGWYQFTDKSGNLTSNPDYGLDRTVLVKTDPTFYGGFENSFVYNRFQLDILFQFVKQIGPNYFLGSQPGNFYSDDGVLANQPDFIMDRWQKTGDNKSHQAFSSSYPWTTTGAPYLWATISNAAYSDASFIRLKNLSLSWQLPEKWKQAAHMQNARLYVQGQNLLTITNYKGMDPENANYRNLPPLRVVTVGIQMGF